MAEFIKIYSDNPNPKAVDKVVKVLRNGGLIVFPTDTVYGLACDINNTKGVELMARIKGVKVNNANFSFICSDLSNLSDYVKQIDSRTFRILKRALPGPYTFVLPGSRSLPNVFKKKRTVGIRIPDNAITLEIVRQLGNPIISTSIRDEDEIVEYTTDPELIYEKWKKQVDLVIDGGYGDNQASTVIDLSEDEPEIIRVGKGPIDIF